MSSDLLACALDKMEDDCNAWMQCADKWQGRALDAENSLGEFKVCLEQAVGDFEHHGNKSLFLERLHKLLDIA